MTHKGEGIFVCYDINTRQMAESGWRHKQLTKSIQSNFHSDNILLLADCCFSGTLQNVAKDLSENGLDTASLTSAGVKNGSTDNWSLTPSFVESLLTKSIATSHQGTGPTFIRIGTSGRPRNTMRSRYGKHHKTNDSLRFPIGTQKMTGQPNTQGLGDQVTAWAPATMDDQKVWVELDYKEAITPKEIHIHENGAPGSVYQVTSFAEKKLYFGKASTPRPLMPPWVSAKIQSTQASS